MEGKKKSFGLQWHVRRRGLGRARASMASGGAFANPDAMGLTEVAEFYCALLAGELLAASCWNAGTCACGVTRARDGNFG
jgi:hypothetical protein